MSLPRAVPAAVTGRNQTTAEAARKPQFAPAQLQSGAVVLLCRRSGCRAGQHENAGAFSLAARSSPAKWSCRAWKSACPRTCSRCPKSSDCSPCPTRRKKNRFPNPRPKRNLCDVVQSCFPSLAASPVSAARERFACADSLTSPLKTRVGVSRRHASGRLSRRRRFHSMFTPGSRACGCRTASGRAKWLNRAPIGELGGLNLYGYVSNDPLDRYDPFGEADAPKDQPPVTTPPIFGEKPFRPGSDNCLCYALDRPGGALQPDGGDARNNAKKCADLMKQIKANFKGVGDVPKDGNCPFGSHKIAVFADGDGGYHVQRQDSGGDWSEMSLNPTYPPRKCKKGVNSPGKPCGDLCAPDQPKLASPSPSR